MTVSPRQQKDAEPTWEIAELFPTQGQWSEGDYFALQTNRLVEFSHGHVEVLPMPTLRHQFIVLYLYRLIQELCVAEDIRSVLVAPVRVMLWEGKYREPDVVFVLAENTERLHEQYIDGADLVVEVVSSDARERERDLVHKRREYARAGIPEYWIVDPETERVTVLRLDGEQYAEHGTFRRGEMATSVFLKGLTVSVDDAFDAGR